MSKSIGKHGFPVLAYLTQEPLSLPFSMRLQHHAGRKQVTLMLRTSATYMLGAEEELAFVAQYDADNLLPETALNAATVHVPQPRRVEIERYAGQSHVTTLSLTLKHPCTLWCPIQHVLLPTPVPTAVEHFNELVQLAKSTNVHIVFDKNWLSPEQEPPLQWLVKGKEALTGFPVADFYSRHYRRADWTVFGPPLEVPPKRRRKASTSPSSPPPYKRANVNTPPSPTEKATSPAAPKSPFSDTHTNEGDFQTLAISAVVRRHLPAIVAALLPPTVDTRLSTLLPSLFTLPKSFTSSPPSTPSQFSQPSQPDLSRLSPERLPSQPPIHTLTPLGASLLPHILAHLTPQLSKLHSTALARHVTYQSRAAALELDDALQDALLELQQVRDDSVAELVKQGEYVLDEVREKGVDVGEDVGERVENEVEKRMWEVGERVFERERKRLERRVGQLGFVRVESSGGELVSEGYKSDCACACACCSKGSRSTAKARASVSFRGGKGGYRNLGERWKAAAAMRTC